MLKFLSAAFVAGHSIVQALAMHRFHCAFLPITMLNPAGAGHCCPESSTKGTCVFEKKSLSII